jgi:hypothetical protein
LSPEAAAPGVDDEAVLDGVEVAELAPLVDDLFMSLDGVLLPAGAEAAGGVEGVVLVLGFD